ncbi:MAG: choice-of-anchor D domain-containing protein [Bacteroidales bacterium]|nr:choice-of-anchor D domain-containing protein [Bacteroidales bacterium]
MKKNLLIATIPVIAILMGFSRLSAQHENHSKDWSIVATYNLTGKVSGLAWDGQYIYYGIYGVNGDKVYRFDPATGQANLLFSNPLIGDSYGMTYDGEFLWIIDQPSGSSNPALAKKLGWDGTILTTITLPDHYMSGIAYDDGDFWVCTYYPDPGKVYKVTDQGTVLSQFVPPSNQPWDACLQDEFLWIADYNAYTLCKVDTTSGQVIECHDAENQRPAGIVYDGQYLWYADGPTGGPSVLYKVDLGGSGTPQINVPITSWDYGNVAVGDSSVWDMNVGNTGTAPLVIESLQIPNAVPIFSWETFPITLEPGESTGIEMIFRPTEPGSLNTSFQVLSTDPITPQVNITLTGEAVLVGPAIEIPITSHNYGAVRKNAQKRWFLEVKNIGNAMLNIESMISSEPAFFVDPNLTFPVMISPLETVQLGIWFSPPGATNYAGTLTIANNDPQNPSAIINLSGSGLDQSYPLGEPLWNFTITGNYDNSPKAIKSIRDISGDGVDDVIVCSEDNMVRCFNGNSHGTADIFWEFEIYSGNIYQQQGLVIHDDINGDGYQDVVVGTTGGDRSITAICGKTGQQIWKFATGSMWGTGGWVYQVDAAMDYNADGIADVLGAAGNDGTGTGPRRAFCVNGATGAYMWDNFFEGPGFAVMSIPDVNGDGIPDAIGGASNASETQGKVVGINGANGATLWSQSTAGSSVWGLALIDDINNDGIQDAAAGSFNGNYYGYNPVNGGILFSGSIGGSPIITRLFRIEDVDADGYADLLFGSSSSNCVIVSGFDGLNIWLKPLVDKSWNVAVIEDISGDGINDVVAGTLFSNNYVYFLDGITGNEMKSFNYGEAIDAITTIPDINDDHSMEAVVGGRNGKLFCYSGGVDAFTSVQNPSANSNFAIFSANPNPFSDFVTISIDLPEKVNFDVSIMSAGGLLIRDMGSYQTDGHNTEIHWDGENSIGSMVNPGLYFAVISIGKYHKAIKLIKQ